MAAELKYNGEWLIPLQQGYRVSSGHSASLAGGYPTSMLRRQAVTVAASYRLKDAAMIAWWWEFYEANRGLAIEALLDTAGYMSAHTARIVEPPQFTEYAGHTAAVTIQWVCNPAPAVVTQYATSWPYPRSIEPPDKLAGSAAILAGARMLSSLNAGDDLLSGLGSIIAGGTLKGVTIPYESEDDRLTGFGSPLAGGVLRSPLINYDLRVFDTERLAGSALVASGGIIKTTAINHDLRTFDTERITGAGVIRTGGSIA